MRPDYIRAPACLAMGNRSFFRYSQGLTWRINEAKEAHDHRQSAARNDARAGHAHRPEHAVAREGPQTAGQEDGESDPEEEGVA